MTAPVGAIVGLYVDLVAPVLVGDVIETGSGRRYGVLVVRVQQRGRHAGRQHLRCTVLGAMHKVAVAVGAVAPTVHHIRWYCRQKRGRP